MFLKEMSSFTCRRAYMEHLPSHTKLPRGKTLCCWCGYDPENLESSVKHFRDVLGDDTFMMSSKKDKEVCQICERKGLKKEKDHMVHIRIHFEEAHRKKTSCDDCNVDYPNV